MNKMPVILFLLLVLFVMLGRCYYLDSNDDTEAAFSVARWMLLPFTILIDVCFFGFISRLITIIMNIGK